VFPLNRENGTTDRDDSPCLDGLSETPSAEPEGKLCCDFLAVATTALPAFADGQSPTTADLIEALRPSVVDITVTRQTRAESPPGNIVTQNFVDEKEVDGSGFILTLINDTQGLHWIPLPL
jgi:hypothetical protein